jgi:hypothetical protein
MATFASDIPSKYPQGTEVQITTAPGGIVTGSVNSYGDDYAVIDGLNVDAATNNNVTYVPFVQINFISACVPQI